MIARDPGSIFDAIEPLPDLSPPRPTTNGLKPAPSMGEVFSAGRTVQRVDNSDFERRMVRDGYEPILDALGPIVLEERNYMGRRYPVHLINPGDATEAGQTTPYGSVRSMGQMEEAVAKAIRDRRAKDPAFLKGVPDTVKGLRAYFIEQEKKKRKPAKETLDRAEGLSGFLAGLGGAAVESLADPVTVATLPIGGGGRTLTQIFIRETAINGAVELLLQPKVAQNRELIGEELTLGEAAANVGFAAVVGGGLETGVAATAKGTKALEGKIAPVIFNAMPASVQRRWADRMKVGDVLFKDVIADMSNREVAAFAKGAVPPEKMSPAERDSIAILERESDVGESSPFEGTPTGQAQHELSLRQTMEDLQAGRRPRSLLEGAEEPAPFVLRNPPASALPDPLAPAPAAGATPAPAPAARGQATGRTDPQLGSLAEGLVKRGIPPHIARGAAAGIIAESRGQISIRGPVTRATKGERAYGLGQWLFERATRLFQRYGPNPTREQQLDYLAWELKGGDFGGKSVLAAKDESDALRRYIVDFMRPGKGKETDGDMRRGMAALGRGNEAPPSAAGVGGSSSPLPANGGDVPFSDPRIAGLREEAMQLEQEILGLTAMPDGSRVTLQTRNVPASSILVDANRFQFKSGGDEFGVTERLQGVGQWDDGLAGRVTLWEDTAGKLWIADGHQRHGLARRISAEQGSDIGMDAMVLRERDGVSAEDARVWAALKNISEGTGSAVDAAKVIRDTGLDAALKRLPPKSPLVRDGANLARLSDAAFGAVYNERIAADQAAVIGELLPDNPDAHLGMVDLLIKMDPANRAQARSIVRQGIAAGFHEGEQIDLFGGSTSVSSLFIEKAKILERGIARLRKMKLVHKTAAKEADELEAKGSSIARSQSEKEAQANAEAIELIDRLAYRAGPVSDALGDAARSLAGGARLADAADGFVARIRDLDLAALSREDGIDAGSGGGLDGAGREGDADEEGPGLFDAPEQPTLADLEAATERFSDPDGPAVKRQAEDLVHDFRATIEQDAERVAPVFDDMSDEEVAEILAGEVIEDALNALAIDRGRVLRLEYATGEELQAGNTDYDKLLEELAARANDDLAGDRAALEKLARKALEEGRLKIVDEGEPDLDAPKPMRPVESIAAPTNPRKAADYAGEFMDAAAAKARLEEWKAEAKRIGQESPPPPGTVILSLFDASGRWSQPYRDMGYEVVQLDIKLGHDLLEDMNTYLDAIDDLRAEGGQIVGVIAQPPCTTFASSGARWWDPRHNRGWSNMVEKMWGRRASKFFDTPVEYNQFLVAATAEFIARANPRFHAVENPNGRIAKLTGLPKPNLVIQPHHFGDAYTKHTNLWGDFNNELPTANVSPKKEDGGEGSRMWNLRGDDEKDQGLRSLTPEGFAYAFALANRPGTEAVNLSGDVTRFASGMSRKGDLQAGTYALGDSDKMGVGVEVNELSAAGIQQIARAIVDWRTDVFVDSGAFPAFRRGLKGKPSDVDFDKVLARYDEIEEAIGAYNEAELAGQDLGRLLLVMPDKVGDQAGSLELLRKYATRVKAQVGANNGGNRTAPIVPLQKGELSIEEAFEEAARILGTRDFIVGVPSNEAALSLDEFAAFLAKAKPTGLHFLGATSDKTLGPKIDVLNKVAREQGLELKHLSADANLLRSKLYGRADASGENRPIAVMETLRREDLARGSATAKQYADDTAALAERRAEASSSAVLHASPAVASRREMSQAATKLLDAAAKPGQLHSVRPFPDDEPDYHRFLFMSADGKTKVAGKYTYENGEIDNLDIGDTNNPVDLGAGDVRSMIKQLRELHPETVKLSAYRMTGARAASGEGPEFVSFDFKPKAKAEAPLELETADYPMKDGGTFVEATFGEYVANIEIDLAGVATIAVNGPGAGTLGAATVRQLMRELRVRFPAIKSWTGMRVSGARAELDLTDPRKLQAIAESAAPARFGDLMSSSSTPALDLGAAIDPAKAARDRQLVELQAAAPMRASNDVDQLGDMGLELFDAVNQPTLSFRLGEEGDEISGADLLAELEADDKAIATLRGCL